MAGAGVAHRDRWVSLEVAGRALGVLVVAAAAAVVDAEGLFDGWAELAAIPAPPAREAMPATFEGPTNEDLCWLLTGCTRLGGIEGAAKVP